MRLVVVVVVDECDDMMFPVVVTLRNGKVGNGTKRRNRWKAEGKWRRMVVAAWRSLRRRSMPSIGEISGQSQNGLFQQTERSAMREGCGQNQGSFSLTSIGTNSHKVLKHTNGVCHSHGNSLPSAMIAIVANACRILASKT